MKNKINLTQVIVALLIALIFQSCKVDDSPLLTPEVVKSVEILKDKKGVAYSYKTEDWSHKTSELGANWFYHWGNLPKDEIPDNVEYVPMFWGKNSVSEENINRLIDLKNEGKIKYILAFNEPDGAEQSNMTVEEVVALWPKLESIGLPIISPAPVGFKNAWMTAFMAKVNELNLRVDYIAVHSYGGPSAESFLAKLFEAYKLYNKPLWITEFAVGDWTATSPETNKHSEAAVLQFMQNVLPRLDALDWVVRYAWFDGSGRAPLYTSALYDEEGNITTLGSYYKQHEPNPIIGPGSNTTFEPPVDEGNLMANGGFETGNTDSWDGFKLNTADVSTTTPYEGSFCLRLQSNDAGANQVISVDSGKTYVLKFQSKWLETVANTFLGKIKNNTDNSNLWDLPEMPKTDQWTETSFDFTVPAGVTELKLVFFKGKVDPVFPAFFVDNVDVREK